MTWTEDRVDALRRYWADGLSSSQIAGRIGGAVTRNAVIGKVHRLGLAQRAAAPARARPRHKLPPLLFGAGHSSGAKPPKPLPPEPASAVARVTLQDLEARHCRWPIGDPRQPSFGFCGSRALPGRPYCSNHCAKAYVKI